MAARRILILGAAGRDFHDFNVRYRDDPAFEVVAFTATQIPGISDRVYPPELAGKLYPAGIPIVPEAELEDVVREKRVDTVVFAYSDVPHEHVMHVASRALAAGATFELLGPHDTELGSTKPVLSIGAVRTGAGKSPLARYVARWLRERGHRVAILRHPMPYGDLARQAVQRFATLEDLDAADCTVEEREEYEPHLREGAVVYAGVDYARILAQAETEADVVLWEGGNNDLPFLRPDLHIVLLDPHRAGDETRYHPGEANLRLADALVVGKVSSARVSDVEVVEAAAREANPDAPLARGDLSLDVDDTEALRGKRVLVVEDGPTLTHGGMAYGAGKLAAEAHGAVIVDPRPFAAGSLQAVYRRFPHLTDVLPAMGYDDAQVRELEVTIQSADVDLVVDATPVDLARILVPGHPVVRVTYAYEDLGGAVRGLLETFERDHLETPTKEA